MIKTAIISAIAAGGFSLEDLNDILYAVRRARRVAAKARVSLFSLGTNVTFIRGGKRQTGVVAKLNKSSAIVTCGVEPVKVSLISLRRM